MNDETQSAAAVLARKVIGRLMIVVLFPAIVTQALSLRRRALNFVPAAGSHEGRIGLGEPFRFLAIGDSIISGAGARRIRRCVLPQRPPTAYDALLLSVGVNDVVGPERSATFRKELEAALAELRRRSPQAVIGHLGLPPLDEFPKLRRPLRRIVGSRVRRFDALAREVLASLPDVVHVPLVFSP